jgi:hypothetical protein
MWGGKEEGMKRVCSWCNKEMGTTVGSRSGPDQVITHGICGACAADVLADIETVELYSPERHPGNGLRSINYQAKLPGWQRPV